MKTIAQQWDDSIVPALTEYIRIPASNSKDTVLLFGGGADVASGYVPPAK